MLKYVIAAALLLSSVPAYGAPKVADHATTLSMDVSKDAPFVCAVNMISNVEQFEMGEDQSQQGITDYAAMAKLTPEQIVVLRRECYLFEMGAVFISKLANQKRAAPVHDLYDQRSVRTVF